MLFPSIEFAVFLVFVLVVAWGLALLPSDLPRKLFLLAASLFFYAFWSLGFALLLVVVATGAWLVALANLRLAAPAARRTVLAVGVAAALGVLAWFKYYNFLVAQVMNTGLFDLFGSALPFVELALPVAISFFTFHAISYMVDAWKGRFPPTRSLPDVILYMSFFPHLVAGPIVRAAEFIPQLRARPQQTAIPYAECLVMIVGGLFKKMVLANYLAVAIVDPVFTAPAQFSSADLLLAAVAYSFQIYFDFSAYTSIAIGVAALLGYRFPDNFDQPYRSLSPREFWTRWHITLSTWLRDYLYIPLGGNRRGLILTIRNLMITMLLGGLWHGASLTFVAWGALHGLALVLNHLWNRTRLQRRLTLSPLYKAACLFLTFALVTAAWIPFRAPDFATATEYFAGIFGSAGPSQLATPFLLALLGVGVIGQFIPADSRVRFSALLTALPLWLQVIAFAAAMAALMLLAPSQAAPFIYFQF